MTLHRHWADLPNDIPNKIPAKPAPAQPVKPSFEDRIFEELLALRAEVVALRAEVQRLALQSRQVPAESLLERAIRQQRQNDDMKRYFLDAVAVGGKPEAGRLLGKSAGETVKFEAHHAKDALVTATINAVWANMQSKVQADCGSISTVRTP